MRIYQTWKNGLAAEIDVCGRERRELLFPLEDLDDVAGLLRNLDGDIVNESLSFGVKEVVRVDCDMVATLHHRRRLPD